MNNFKTKRRGETITEVMVAVTVLVGVLVAGFGVLQSALSTNADIRNRIIATNIAREGLEGVRNIRDTNWLKYSGDKLDKWLCNDLPDNINRCDATNNPDNNLKKGFYKIDFKNYTDTNRNTGTRYFILSDNAIPLDLKTTPEAANTYRLWEQYTDKRFVHNEESSPPATLAATPFHRQIELDPETNDTCTPQGCNERRLHVISRVQWKEENAVQEVKLETYLYNYYKLDAYPPS